MNTTTSPAQHLGSEKNEPNDTLEINWNNTPLSPPYAQPVVTDNNTIAENNSTHTINEMEVDDDNDGQLDDSSDNDDDGIDVFIGLDLEIKNEIKQLLKNITPRLDGVTIEVNGSLIAVPKDVAISQRLRTMVWGAHLMRTQTKPYRFLNANEFETILKQNPKFAVPTDGKTIGFFGAIYAKPGRTTYITNSTFVDKSINHRNSYQHLNQDNTNRSYHIYKEFTLIIMRDGRVLDMAVHGSIGNLEVLVENYKPTEIYCLGSEQTSLWHFIQYKYQPFSSFSHLFKFLPVNFNYEVIQFCPFQMQFCSFCRAINTAMAFYNQRIRNRYNLNEVLKKPIRNIEEHKYLTRTFTNKVRLNTVSTRDNYGPPSNNGVRQDGNNGPHRRRFQHRLQRRNNFGHYHRHQQEAISTPHQSQLQKNNYPSNFYRKPFYKLSYPSTSSS